jgi:hypothetical protein
MPVRPSPAVPAVPVSPPLGVGGGKPTRGPVRQAAKSALLAAGLGKVQSDDETPPAWRLFDPGRLDRLAAPLTRFRD